MMAMDGLVRERDVVVAVPANAENLARESNRHGIRTFADVDPGLVSDRRRLGRGWRIALPARRTPPHRAADREKPGQERHGTRKRKTHSQDRRPPIGLGKLRTCLPRGIHDALVHGLHAKLNGRPGWCTFRRLGENGG